MAYQTHRCLKSIMAFGLILFCASPVISADARKGADIANPFPRTVLDHNVFTVFRSVNLLGYVFRDDKREILGPRFWEGKEVQASMGDKEISADFNDDQKILLQELFPGVSFKKGRRTEAIYRVAMKGIKVRRLTKPILQNEYRDLPDLSERGYISSVLSADEVIMQVLYRSSAGIQAADEKSFGGVLEGHFRYSKEHGGVVAAKNAVIGYVLSKPSAEDMGRPSENLGELRTLAVFPLEFKGGDEKYAFMAEYLKEIFEEALIGIPDITIDSDRPDETKYHLKGSIREAGKKLQIELTLYNTYNQKQAVKLSRLTGVGERELADMLSEAVVLLSEGLRIELREKDLWRQEHVVEMARGMEMMQDIQRAQKLRNAGDYKKSEAISRKLLKQYPENIYLLRMLGNILADSSKYAEAVKTLKNAEDLCEKRRHPDREMVRLDRGSAYLSMGDLKGAGSILFNADINMKTELERKNAGGKSPHPFIAKAVFLCGAHRLKRGQAHGSAEEYGSALNHFMEASDMYMRMYGADSWRLAPIYQGIYVAYAQTGRFTESLESCARCLRLVQLKYGNESVQAAMQYANNGAIYDLAGMQERALENVDRGLSILRKKLKNENNADYATIYRYLGRIYTRSMDFARAERYFKKSLVIHERIYAGSSTEFGGLLGEMASMEIKRGNTVSASAYLKRLGYNKEQIRERISSKDESKK